MKMFNKLKCKLNGHDYDKFKYEKDLKDFYGSGKYRCITELRFESEEKIKDYFYNVQPRPFCKRCNLYINTMDVGIKK